MADQVKNLMIGLFVTAAAAVVVFILMFLHPRIGDEGRTLHVRFTDIDKITVGTRVTYAGKPVGEVIDIKEIEEGRTGKTDPSGHVYIYDLTLRVDSKVKVFNTDEVATRTSGLLGEKNVEITPIAPEKGKTLIEIDGTVIYAQQTGTVEETFKEFKEAANKLETTLQAATDILNQVKENKLVEKITSTVENIESISAALNQPTQISEIVSNVHKFSNSLNATWVNVDAFIESARHSWVSVDKFIKDIDDAALSITKFMGQGQGIFSDITEGKGTLGKFLGSDDTYLRTSSIMSKLETILDDINHYGLLFQSDKGWQRLRARRMNLLQKLCTPQEFRNYFNDEVNQISTSISRVAMVLNEIENDPCTCDVMQDREFTKVFAELMRRVTMLEEEVRMYNTQVVEAQIHTTELGSTPCFPPKCQNDYNEYVYPYYPDYTDPCYNNGGQNGYLQY
jgi:phospholipid/cholesterol/gamma-HCH transport system substrate-binding protein